VHRGFKLTHRHDSNGCCSREFLLAPIQQASGGSALFRRDHLSKKHKPLIPSILSKID
jgi:hypothetical protein